MSIIGLPWCWELEHIGNFKKHNVRVPTTSILLSIPQFLRMAEYIIYLANLNVIINCLAHILFMQFGTITL